MFLKIAFCSLTWHHTYLPIQKQVTVQVIQTSIKEVSNKLIYTYILTIIKT